MRLAVHLPPVLAPLFCESKIDKRQKTNYAVKALFFTVSGISPIGAIKHFVLSM
jgi:hypothetical protein